MSKQVVVIAGPAGSGKDSIIREVMKRFPKTDYLVKATTRPMRPEPARRVAAGSLRPRPFRCCVSAPA